MIAIAEFGIQQITGSGLVVGAVAGLVIYVVLGRRR